MLALGKRLAPGSKLAPGAAKGVMLGLEARGSDTPEAGAREDSVFRSGTKTLMNDPIRADLRPSPYNVWVYLRGEFRRIRPSAGASPRDILGLG